MFQQLVRHFVRDHGPQSASRRRFRPVLAWTQPTARAGSRRPSLRCIWRTDPKTGRLQCHWELGKTSSASGREPDPDWTAVAGLRRSAPSRPPQCRPVRFSQRSVHCERVVLHNRHFTMPFNVIPLFGPSCNCDLFAIREADGLRSVLDRAVDGNNRQIRLGKISRLISMRAARRTIAVRTREIAGMLALGKIIR